METSAETQENVISNYKGICSNYSKWFSDDSVNSLNNDLESNAQYVTAITMLF